MPIEILASAPNMNLRAKSLKRFKMAPKTHSKLDFQPGLKLFRFDYIGFFRLFSPD